MQFRQIIPLLSSARWLAYLLPWFMLLLIFGTVAQRYIGLVEAQKLFFSSWILWLGPVPMPGGILTLALITLNLTAKLLWFSPWVKSKIGTIISHIAILMLLLGGGVTYVLHQEGYVSLMEGESTAQMQDYYTRELVVSKDGKPLIRWPEEVLQSAKKLTHPTLPFTIKVDNFCSNCGTFVQEKPKHKRGLAKKLMLQKVPLAKEKEDNKAGLTFTVNGLGYVAYELLPSKAPVINGYRIELARQATPLPFTIRLLDFEKIRYPGSDQAREYQSLVEIQIPADDEDSQPSKARREAGGTEAMGACPQHMKCWQTTIAMNEPLRYQGYAMYQSSFLQAGDTQASVLAVVKNDGWLLPYFSTFLLAVGLIWQCMWRRQRDE